MARALNLLRRNIWIQEPTALATHELIGKATPCEEIRRVCDDQQTDPQAWVLGAIRQGLGKPSHVWSSGVSLNSQTTSIVRRQLLLHLFCACIRFHASRTGLFASVSHDRSRTLILRPIRRGRLSVHKLRSFGFSRVLIPEFLRALSPQSFASPEAWTVATPETR
jgi:hypothetical protein